MDWQDLERFPLANGRWQCSRPPRNRVLDGEDRVAKSLRRWHPFDPLIVATPDSRRFAPPICVPEISKRVYATTINQFRFVMALLLCSAVLVTGALLADIGKSDKLLRLLGAFVAFLLFFLIDYLLVLRYPPRMRERALFVNFIYQETHGVLTPLLCLVVVAGLLQLAMQQELGGLEPLVRRFGLVFSSASAGEYWRYAVGPLLHSGPVHWINNLVMLTVAAGIAGAIGKKSVVLHFLVYVFLASIAVGYLPLTVRPEALVGVSGGIFGLLGWIIGVAQRNRNRFPRYFSTFLVMFALLSLGLSLMLAPNASNTAHIAGLFLGIIVGVFNIGVKQSFRATHAARPEDLCAQETDRL